MALTHSNQDALLQGVAEATACLVATPDFQGAVIAALASLGRMAQADRVYVYENQSGVCADSGWSSKRMEWCREGIRTQIDNPLVQTLSYLSEIKQLYTVLAAGKPYQTWVCRMTEEKRVFFQAQDIVTILLIPIYVEMQLWGILGLDDCVNERTWNSSELFAFQIAALGIGNAMRQNRVDFALRQAKQLESDEHNLAEALRCAVNAINQTLNLKEVLEQILQVIDKVVPNDSANVMLIEKDQARMTAWRGYDHLQGIQLSGQARDISEIPNMMKMNQTGQPIVVPDTQNSSDWIQLETSHRIRSYVSAPICHNKKTIGFLNLNSSTPDFYTKVHAERLRAFADQVAIAIENARLYEQAQQELLERKKAEEALQQALVELENRVELRTLDLRRANDQLNLELARRRQAEKTLEEERALLAMRVEERTAELSLATIQLAKAARLKDSFLASMSHELRTPLNAILNISESLLEQVYGPLADGQKNALRTIEESGEHLLLLINDILDLSKLGAGRLELLMDEVDVNAVCLSSLQFIQETAKKKTLIVSSSLDPLVKTVWADARRLRQILVNLLSNAVKFTPNGGSIGLAVTGTRDNKEVRFTIWDSGIGIPAEKIKQLFKPFIQLDNSLARHYEGTGLGLALVYSLVELHGGGIFLESEVGRGSSFTVILKWEEENEVLPARTQQGKLDEPILIDTEDAKSDPILQFRQCCNELGIEADNYWFEPESVHKAIDGEYELFLLDVRLIAKERDLLAVIKNAPQTKNTPIVMLTQSRQLVGRSTLPLSITFLEYPFSASDVRQIIRRVSPHGTANLIRRVAVFVERNDQEMQSRPIILLVGEDQTSKRILFNYLNAFGYRLVNVLNGSEAIERAREVHPDLILMEIPVPELDGLEPIKRIRHDSQINHIPIIATTTLSMPGDRSRCLKAGADEYLTKPLSLRHLSEVIEFSLKTGPHKALTHVDKKQEG